MDLRKLKTLIDLVSESNVSELEITEAEGKVRIVKSSGAVLQAPMAAPVAQVIRLDAEQVRDALLAATGKLDLTEGGPSADFSKPRCPRPWAMWSSHRWWERSTVLRVREPSPSLKSVARSRKARPSASSKP